MFLIILSFIIGFVLLITGIYFLSSHFLEKINDATGQKSSENLRRNQLRAKLCGYVALSLGSFTIAWGFMLFSFPQIQAVLGLIYMFLLLGAVTILMILMK